MQDGHELTGEFREQALQEAREYGRQLSPDDICYTCADIDLEPWQDERLKKIAGWKIEEKGVPFFRQAPEPPTDQHLVFYHDEVFRAFREAWNEHAAPEEECFICLDDDLDCGHDRTVWDCPA